MNDFANTQARAYVLSTKTTVEAQLLCMPSFIFFLYRAFQSRNEKSISIELTKTNNKIIINIGSRRIDRFQDIQLPILQVMFIV